MGVKSYILNPFVFIRKKVGITYVVCCSRLGNAEVCVQLTWSKYCVMTIGDRIKEVRGKRSQDDFAQMHGIHRNTLSRWESGKRSPEYSFLRDITERHGLAPNWVLMGIGPKLLTESADKEASLRTQLLELERAQMRLQEDYISLSKENRILIKENADLRITLAEEKVRITRQQDPEKSRKTSD